MQNQEKAPLNSLEVNKFLNWEVGSDYEIEKQFSLTSLGPGVIALHKPTNRKVIIEKITQLFYDMSETIKILRELILYRKLKYPHLLEMIEIIQPLDLQNFDAIYVVFEHRQSNMQKLFRSPIHLENIDIQHLLYYILVGLKYLHSVGLVHRNLRPKNILINEDCSVRICGFSSTKSLREISIGTTWIREPDISQEKPKKIGKLARRSGGLVKKNIRRELSGPLFRLYRAPDLVLLRDSHNSAVDIWSVGCIFAELLLMKKENAPTFLDRGPIFPGIRLDSDFSSKKFKSYEKETLIEDYEEHFASVLATLGTPKEEDLAFLTDKTVLKFFNSFAFKREVDWSELYPNSSVEALDLLQRMLEFNPKKRIKADECLYHPFFAEITNKTPEQKIESPIDLSVDLQLEETMSMEQIRELYIKEIMYYKKS